MAWVLPGCNAPAAVTCTPTKLDGQQRELLEQLAVLRDEEHVEPAVTEHPTGLFSRIKEAFSGK